jgi:hypothetical protein
LKPVEFHAEITNAINNLDSDEIALIDVRNIYETRIGRFDVSDQVYCNKVKVFDPRSRQVRYC